MVGESASELFAAKGEAASVLFAAESEATAGGRGRSRRSDHGCGQGDPCRSRSGAKRSFQARRQGLGGASKPGGEDGAAVEVTAEVGASKPITAGDVAGRDGGASCCLIPPACPEAYRSKRGTPGQVLAWAVS